MRELKLFPNFDIGDIVVFRDDASLGIDDLYSIYGVVEDRTLILEPVALCHDP